MKYNIEPVRDWFGFTRRERRSSFILLLVVIVVLAVRYIVPENNITVEDITDTISGVEENPAFENNKKPVAAVSSRFDSSSAPFESVIKPAQDEKEAKTLIKYRNSGGIFRKQSGISRVRGSSVAKAGYLSQSDQLKTDTAGKPVYNNRSARRSIIDINTCDSSQLVELPGIGPVLSARIIRFRNLLGGFAFVEQIKEVYGLPPETFELIRGRLFADTTDVIRIKINSAGYKELIRLPYFDKYEVSAILKYRELKSRIRGINDLTANKLVSGEKARKVSPYLSFE